MKTCWIKTGILVCVATLVPTMFCAANEAATNEKTIVEIAVGNPTFSKLVAAVKAAGLVETLSSEGPFTVFAPTDAAFEALGEETLKSVLADKNKLTSILTYHVVKGNVPASDAVVLAKYEKSFKTVNGKEINLSLKQGLLFINENSKVIATDIVAKNGVIHVIDKVLLPSSPLPSQAARLIEHCIEVGAPQYNSGHHRECATVYQKAAMELLQTYPDVMPTSAQKRLQTALNSIHLSGRPTESAWILRHALDDVYTMMQPTKQTH